MNSKDLFIKPKITEKSLGKTKTGIYAFEVKSDITKTQIKQSIEELFKVKIASVKTVTRKGKERRVGKRQNFKKLADKKIAYIRVLEGENRSFPTNIMNTQIVKTQDPEKSLIRILKKHSGRDSSGRVSVRHQGGRQKRYFRMIDFKRDKRDIEGNVIRIEYDPNRTSNIALIEYSDGEKRYILHPEGLRIGDKILSSAKADIKIGNATNLKNIPLGTQIHNIELYPTKGGQMIKSAGGYAVIVAKDESYADIKLPSKEVRKVLLNCWVTVGQISNVAHKLEHIGKAGRSRLMGRRPTVRGVAQNPRSHSHGGGEGKSGIGMHPKTPTGKIAMGGKTRHPKKWSNKLIVKSRKQK